MGLRVMECLVQTTLLYEASCYSHVLSVETDDWYRLKLTSSSLNQPSRSKGGSASGFGRQMKTYDHEMIEEEHTHLRTYISTTNYSKYLVVINRVVRVEFDIVKCVACI